MMLGLIRPTGGSVEALRPRPREGGRPQGARRSRRLRRGAALLPVPLRPQEPAAARRLRRPGRERARIDEMLDVVELRDRAGDRVGGYSHGMRQRLGIAASLLRKPSACSCSTSRRPGSILRACVTCARSSAGSRARASPSSCRATCWARSRSCATASRSSAQVRSSTRAPCATCSQRRQTEYRLRATEPERALHDLLGPEGRGRRCRVDGARAPLPRPTSRRPPRSRSPSGRLASASPRSSPRRQSLEGRFLGLTGGESGGQERVASRRSHDARVYRWESREAAGPEADVPRAGRGDARPADLRRSCCSSSRAGRTTCRSAATSGTRASSLPFVALFFMSFWAFPLITALVAGDVVASESQNGTLKTILTRSRERGQVFAGKVLATFTYTAAVVVAMGDDRADRGRARLGIQPADVPVRNDGVDGPRRSRCSRRASRFTSCRWPGSRRSRSCSRRSRGTGRRRWWVR